MDLIVSAEGVAAYCGVSYRCAIGKGGIRADKTEGDSCSPAGVFTLIRLFYRADRLSRPAGALPAITLSRSDGWCDDPADAAYNRPVSLPYPASCESLYRKDGLYDIVVVTDHNSDPVIPGGGSAIFVHVAGGPEYPPTEGCIAFTRDDLLAILERWDPDEDRLVIG